MTEQQKDSIKQAIAQLKANAVAAVPSAVAVTLKLDWTNEMALTEVTIHHPNRSGYEAFAIPSTALPNPE